jgi:hypothetical protein
MTILSRDLTILVADFLAAQPRRSAIVILADPMPAPPQAILDHVREAYPGAAHPEAIALQVEIKGSEAGLLASFYGLLTAARAERGLEAAFWDAFILFYMSGRGGMNEFKRHFDGAIARYDEGLTDFTQP